MKTTIIVALTLSLMGLFASAADGEKKSVPPLVPEDGRGRFLKKYDKNGDGQIDEAERTAAMQERRKEIEAREKERIKKYDKNGNGKLDDDERAAAREDFQKQRGQTGETNSRPPVIERPPVKKLEKPAGK
jgi:hypothetical protein